VASRKSVSDIIKNSTTEYKVYHMPNSALSLVGSKLRLCWGGLYVLEIRRRDCEFSFSNPDLPRIRADSQHLRLQFNYNNFVAICIIVRRDKERQLCSCVIWRSGLGLPSLAIAHATKALTLSQHHPPFTSFHQTPSITYIDQRPPRVMALPPFHPQACALSKRAPALAIHLPNIDLPSVQRVSTPSALRRPSTDLSKRSTKTTG
jgi:hypothetical protein